jgi:outer membrane protein OmpA-like peptidoglycan-associated protein
MTKLLIGGLGTCALAWGSHAMMGQAFVDHLKSGSMSALAAAGGSDVNVAFGANPLTRSAELSGPVTDPAKRQALLDDVRSVSGVADAHWKSDDVAVAAPAPAGPEKPATAEAVKSCQADVDTVIKGKSIEFGSGTAALTPAGQAMVDALAAKLGPCQGTKVEVAGHTDLTGVAANNQRLSEERANTVVAALVAKGVPTARLTPKGYGQTKPVMPGTTAEANTKNRRIEFSVMAAN